MGTRGEVAAVAVAEMQTESRLGTRTPARRCREDVRNGTGEERVGGMEGSFRWNAIRSRMSDRLEEPRYDPMQASARPVLYSTAGGKRQCIDTVPLFRLVFRNFTTDRKAGR